MTPAVQFNQVVSPPKEEWRAGQSIVPGNKPAMAKPIANYLLPLWLWIIALAWVPILKSAEPGDMDPTFGGTDPTFSIDQILVLQDGRFLTGCDSPTDPTTPCIRRYLVNGRRDPLFDSGELNFKRLWKIADAGSEWIYARVTVAGDPESVQVIRLLPDGQRDAAFAVGITNEISKIAGVPDGGLIVLTGSSPESEEENPPDDRSNQILRLRSDGNLDGTFHPVKDALMISEIMVGQDDRIYVWGQFMEINDAPRFGLARLHMDGSLDQGFNPVPLKSSGAQRPRIASVQLTPQRKLLVLGRFDDARGDGRRNLALLNWDGSLDVSFTPPEFPIDYEYAFSEKGGKVVVIGQFDQVGRATRQSIARLNADGSVDESYLVTPPLGDRVRLGAMGPGDDIIVTGSSGRNLLAKIHAGIPRTGPPLVPQSPTSQVRVRGQDVQFSAAVRSHPPGRYQWRFNGQDVPAATNSAFSIARLAYHHMGSYQLVVSNQFGEITTAPAHLIVNAEPVSPGALDATFDPLDGPNQVVKCIAVQGDKIIILGRFSRYRGAVVGGLARLHPNGALDDTFHKSDSATSRATTMALDSVGRIYIAGGFEQYNGAERFGLVRLSADGELDPTFLPEVPHGVQVGSLALLDKGRVLISGMEKNSRPFTAILDTSGRRDPTFVIAGIEIPSEIRQLAVYPDGRFLGLAMDPKVDGSSRYTVYRFLPNGGLDPTFQTDQVHTDIMGRLHLMPDGGILVGGGFGGLKWAKDPNGKGRLLRLLPDGRVDETFPTGWRVGEIGGFGTFPNGDIAICGFIISRRSPRGQEDPRFQALVPGFECMAWDSQGRMLIGGSFEQVNRTPRNRIARIHTTAQVPESMLWGPFVSAAGFELAFPTVTNHVYALEFSGQLQAVNWSSLLRVSGDGNWQTIRDPATETSTRFYRVRIEPTVSPK